MKIEDNFLEQENFNNLQNIIIDSKFPWIYNSVIEKGDKDKFQFTCVFYEYGTGRPPLMEPILYIIQPAVIYKIKANLLTRTSNIIENRFHSDLENILPKEKLKQWTTSIFYMGTNNGYTKFEDGTKVESVANRMVTFPADMKHLGTSCTDENIRVVINFNYFEST